MSQIHLPPSPNQLGLIDFVRHSALAYCTNLKPNGAAWTVEPQRPIESFSHGERILWSLLESMTRGEIADAFDRLDDRSLVAFAHAMSGMFVSASLDGAA